VLQADVEIGRQRERKLTLEQMREVAIARINTLMHLPPDARSRHRRCNRGRSSSFLNHRALRELAIANRPDLKALADRIAAEQARVNCAEKSSARRGTVGAYDTFWQETRCGAGRGAVNLPVRCRNATRRSRRPKRRWHSGRRKLARLTDQINFQVQEAAAQPARERAEGGFSIEGNPAARS